MVKLIRIVLVLLVILSATKVLYAQQIPGEKPPIKWGDVPRERLEMDYYAPDTNAAAVILADFGNVYFNSSGSMVFERHTRIKILTEAGYEWGTVTVPFLALKQYGQQVHSVKAQTFTLGPNGKVVRHKIEKKAVFHEDIDGDWKRLRFTLPALESGAVVEYTYHITSESPIFLPDWQFQTSEPTLWSEYRADIPNGYQYVRAAIGNLNFVVEESEPLLVQGVVRHRWVMQDVPALREEPFMTTPDDYRAAIEFQLSKYYHPSTGTVDFMNTWESVADEVMGMKAFGKQLQPSRKIRDRVKALTAGRFEPLAKMTAIYDFVRTTITWNGEWSFFADRDVDDVLETHSASQPETALLLAAMLRAAGLEAHPVLISTRSHGRVVEVYPILSQFNAMLVYVTAGGTDYLLDATDPLRPYDLLPYEALNGKGWLVRKDTPTWIPIVATERYRHQSALNATLDASGLLTATLQTSDGGYSALEKRYALKDADTPQVFVTDVLLDGFEEVLVESCTVTNEEELSELLRTESSFSVPAYAQVAGDFIYVTALPLGRLGENPLRQPERTFPVDMAYPRQLTYTIRMALPEGYTVQDVPENVSLQLPVNGGHFRRSIDVQEGVLTVQSQTVIKHSVFKASHYDHLRAFFDRIVSAEAEFVVLKRIAQADTTGENEP